MSKAESVRTADNMSPVLNKLKRCEVSKKLLKTGRLKIEEEQ